MFKLSVISFVLLVGQVWCIPLMRQLGEEGEIVEAADNSLNDSEHFDDTINTEEMGSHFQGDILIPKNALMMRSGLIWQGSRWPNGIMPYEISDKFNDRERALIENVFKEFRRYTCIRIVPRTTEQDYISITNNNNGCYSYVGRIGGKQELNLGPGYCVSKLGVPMHELMHALGFDHEQNREDRDDYVSIQYENLQPQKHFYFTKALNSSAFGVPYDYGSVMHYASRAFSMNGQPTIVPKQDTGNAQMGQRDDFSALDIEKLNRMYC